MSRKTSKKPQALTIDNCDFEVIVEFVAGEHIYFRGMIVNFNADVVYVEYNDRVYEAAYSDLVVV